MRMDITQASEVVLSPGRLEAVIDKTNLPTGGVEYCVVLADYSIVVSNYSKIHRNLWRDLKGLVVGENRLRIVCQKLSIQDNAEIMPESEASVWVLKPLLARFDCVSLGFLLPWSYTQLEMAGPECLTNAGYVHPFPISVTIDEVSKTAICYILKNCLSGPIRSLIITGVSDTDVDYLDIPNWHEKYTIGLFGCLWLNRIVFPKNNTPDKVCISLGLFVDSASFQIEGLVGFLSSHPNIALSLSWEAFVVMASSQAEVELPLRITRLRVFGDSLFKPCVVSTETRPVWLEALYSELIFTDVILCGRQEYLLEIARAKCLTPYGVKVGDISLVAANAPTDFVDATIRRLVRLGMDAKAASCWKNVDCRVEGQRVPGLTIPPFEIDVSADRLARHIQRYRKGTGRFFCQHLTYQQITLTGKASPAMNEEANLKELLTLFGDIRATRLVIKNIRLNQAGKCFLNNPRLHRPSSQASDQTALKYLGENQIGKDRTTITELVFDNVELSVAAFVIERYLFLNPVSIYIQAPIISEKGIVKLVAHLAKDNVAQILIEVSQTELPILVGNVGAVSSSLDKLYLDVVDLDHYSCLAKLKEINAPVELQDHLAMGLAQYFQMLDKISLECHYQKYQSIMICFSSMAELETDLQNCLKQQDQSVLMVSVKCVWLKIDSVCFSAAQLQSILQWVSGRFTGVESIYLKFPSLHQKVHAHLSQNGIIAYNLPDLTKLQIKATTILAQSSANIEASNNLANPIYVDVVQASELGVSEHTFADSIVLLSLETAKKLRKCSLDSRALAQTKHKRFYEHISLYLGSTNWDDLKCGVCLLGFAAEETKPALDVCVLLCSHIICLGCAARLVQSYTLQDLDEYQGQLPDVFKGIVCPICRNITGFLTKLVGISLSSGRGQEEFESRTIPSVFLHALADARICHMLLARHADS
ncbi:hypothetical protein NEHOM01_1925 [Nematocida homosporus]|uniref:uncharacterized protein n=1 Tax=Nematocida homosporus TaxID=1912981 RepID=UPI00221EC366|nr:uncharacterized protein NEHOM01_1925 [Nematocida homosporus]KAI5187092.1 hypothetical protein NEHOM01_1925 [Nematocida homosporus]